jgi:hypothetical protein
MQTLRLKLVADCNFQHNEADNFNEIIKKHKIDQLAPNEVVCLKSLGGAQMVFMYRPREIELTSGRGTAMVYRSVRLRLTRSTWNPMMLQNYANEVDIQLEGLRRFEDALPHLKPPSVKAKKDAKVINIAAARKAA